MPILSVVIPCYNQGHFIKDALDSLARCDQSLFEVIIVNDGSTDAFTNTYLQELAAQGYHVIVQQNQGLGAARNTGVKAATGKYLLPLDADNSIYPAYMTTAIALLDANPDAAVVYGNANYTGDKSGTLVPGPFNLQRLMLGNYIDACAVVRKSVVEELGYYDNMKIMGYEDWDLWLRIAFKGYRFIWVNQVLFNYRVTNASMMKNLNANIAKQNAIEDYFLQKYPDKLDPILLENHFVYRLKKKPGLFLKRMLLKKFFPARYEQLIRENKMYKGHLYQ